MIHCNIVTFSIVIPIQINCKTHCNSFSCDDVLLKYHYYYYYIYRYLCIMLFPIGAEPTLLKKEQLRRS